jgi:hypothetical protein
VIALKGIGEYPFRAFVLFPASQNTSIGKKARSEFIAWEEPLVLSCCSAEGTGLPHVERGD